MSFADDLLAACGQPFSTRGYSRDQLGELMGQRRLLEVLDDRVRVAFRLDDAADYVAFRSPIPRRLVESPPLWSSRQHVLTALHVWLGAPPLHERYPRLVAAVVASPDDDTCRRVVADALLEEGDPRGRFIALQCSGADPAEADELLRIYGRHWRAELGLEQFECTFRRGFVEGLTVGRFVPALDAVFEYTPIRTLVVSARYGSISRLFELLLPAVREVRFARCQAASHLEMLAVHDVARRLEVLGFDAARDLGECLPQLFAGEWPRLKQIELVGCSAPAAALAQLQSTFAGRPGPKVQVVVRP